VAQGRIGRLLHVKADFGYPMAYDPASRVWARELGGGCLLDMGIYPVALAWRFVPRLPEACHAQAWFAPNGADSDVQFGFDYGDCRASLGTSFRCKLPNAAWLIGDRGHIVLPDFWRARECSLYQRDERIDHFADGRRGNGFEFEIEAVNGDLRAERAQPSTVTWADSLAFQALIERVRAALNRPGSFS